MASLNNNVSTAIFHLPLLMVISLFSVLVLNVLAFSSGLYPDNPMTKAPKNWTATQADTIIHMDSSQTQRIIFRVHSDDHDPAFGVGFYCVKPCKSYLFSVFIFAVDGGGTTEVAATTEVIWSANRVHPVSENATLQLTSDNGLTLRDSDGSLVWSTNVSNRFVVGINITESGNLVLFDKNNITIWQSFDHPTNTLMPEQIMTVGMMLTANISATNWSESRVHLTLVANGLQAFVDSNPPQIYFQYNTLENNTKNKSGYLKLTNGNLDMFLSNPSKPDITIPLRNATTLQYMRLEADGQLRLYDYQADGGFDVLSELRNIPESGYPTVCGHYGIRKKGICKCPNSTYFRYDENNKEFTFSCVPVTTISCQDIQHHKLLPLEEISYFNLIDENAAAFKGHGEEHCKQACLQNCSCKAAVFSYFNGNCYLPSEVFTLQDNQLDVGYYPMYNSSTYLKVQLPSPTLPPSPSSVTPVPGSSASQSSSRLEKILGSVFGGLFVLGMIGYFMVCSRRGGEKQEEDFIDEVPGMPTRFTFQELEVATEKFAKKLGEGGFSTVFEGSLGDERIAVKCLNGVGQGKKEFLAEVQTIGSIHHINLVRLIGFCAEKSKRLLVYEYMYNGSLDKWIYGRDGRTGLNWRTRYNIITGIAKGLCYLHEECRQRIVHLDIKPENILLDDNFSAKVADFGLCKLIDRNKSKVMTRMRGTPGYLAPEWLTAMITEKVDVYSFGVVVMEILCGRRNLDSSETEENHHLITLLEEKSKSNQLSDLVHSSIEDIELHKEEVMHVMELAMWCLQTDCSRRPSMSAVVKVLEGAMEVETSLDYNFVSSIPMIASVANDVDQSAPLIASALSGPR